LTRVRRTARAGADLDDIWLNVALDSPRAADRLVDRIVARCQTLAEHPRLGPACPQIASDARMLVIGDYLALYRVSDGDVEVVRVVHGARRLEGLFDSEPEAQ
jgi:toxin ParE1/3/4